MIVIYYRGIGPEQVKNLFGSRSIYSVGRPIYTSPDPKIAIQYMHPSMGGLVVIRKSVLDRLDKEDYQTMTFPSNVLAIKFEIEPHEIVRVVLPPRAVDNIRRPDGYLSHTHWIVKIREEPRQDKREEMILRALSKSFKQYP